jgi:hypothetical protein
MRILEIENFQPVNDTSIKELKVGNASASYQMTIDGVMLISSIRVPRKYRKQGEAKAILKELCKIADNLQVDAKLAASPLDVKTSTVGLIRLYQQYGFELTGETINFCGDPWMIRHPRLEESNINWAIGNNLDKAQIKYIQNDPAYVLVHAYIFDLFKYTSREMRLDLNDPSGGPNAIKDRISNAIQHWKDDGFMDPSEIRVNLDNYRGPISFTNGRHRLYAAYQLGHKYAPVLIPKSELSDLEKIVRIK